MSISFIFLCFYFPEITYAQSQLNLKSIPLDSLESISKDHPDYLLILDEIAQRYLEKNTVHSRRQAATIIRKAIDLNPIAVPPRITLIRILNAQGFYDAARRESKQLIKSIPNQLSHAYSLAEAYYYAGYTSELDGFRYLNMKSNPGIGESALTDYVDLNLSKYANQSFKEAGECYEHAIELNPKHREAQMRLIMLYYEIQSKTIMIKLAEQLKTLYPCDPIAFALSGLAHYSGGQLMQSDQDYRNALELMDEDQAMGYYSIGYIVESDQQRNYKTAKENYETRVPWMEKFWNQKDPVYGTPYNERQLEHYNRVTYANWRYGVRFQNLDGWKTERGMLYIRYGKPAEQFRIQPDDRTLGGWEVWIYPRYTFYFRDDAASGKYLLDNRSMISLSNAFHESADQYRYPGFVIPIQSKYFQFRSPTGLTDILFFAISDTTACSHQLNNNDSITCSGFILDTLYKPLYTSAYNYPIQSVKHHESLLYTPFYLSSVPHDTFHHPYAVELRWPILQSVSTSRGQLELINFYDDSLKLSDIVLCETAALQDRKSLIPKVDSALNREKPVFLYFEIYYLTLNSHGQAKYTITTRIKPVINRSLISKLTEWLSKNQKSDISSSFQVTANSRHDSYSLGIDLSEVPPGDYDLVVNVLDRTSGKTNDRTIRLFIEE
jgi:GWxTD domain-containing protein